MCSPSVGCATSNLSWQRPRASASSSPPNPKKACACPHLRGQTTRLHRPDLRREEIQGPLRLHPLPHLDPLHQPPAQGGGDGCRDLAQAHRHPLRSQDRRQQRHQELRRPSLQAGRWRNPDLDHRGRPPHPRRGLPPHRPGTSCGGISGVSGREQLVRPVPRRPLRRRPWAVGTGRGLVPDLSGVGDVDLRVGARPMVDFNATVEHHGFTRKKTMHGMFVRGLALKNEFDN